MHSLSPFRLACPKPVNGISGENGLADRSSQLMKSHTSAASHHLRLPAHVSRYMADSEDAQIVGMGLWKIEKTFLFYF